MGRVKRSKEGKKERREESRLMERGLEPLCSVKETKHETSTGGEGERQREMLKKENEMLRFLCCKCV